MNLDINKSQLEKWLLKIKRNIIIYKHGYSNLSREERLGLIRRQYHLLLIIKKVLSGKGVFQGFDKTIDYKVTVNEIK